MLIPINNIFSDERGYLVELYREDEAPQLFKPKMSYLSVTKPGMSRGPHEHKEQTDYFVFIDGEYDLYLWPNGPESLEITRVGKENPMIAVVPPGVVHAYKNVGQTSAFVLNFPDQLFKGVNKSEEVDEIRHEEIDSPFRI